MTNTLFTIFICLTSLAAIIGFIKPSIVLPFLKKPTRIKVFLFYILSFLLLGVVLAIFEDRNTSILHNAKNEMKKGNYEDALEYLSGIDSTYENQAELEVLKQKISEKMDSVAIAQKKALEQESIDSENALLSRLSNEIKSDALNGKWDNTAYRNDVSSILNECILFNVWGKLIEECDSSKNPEIKKRSELLRNKVVAFQKKEFPLMRKNYIKILGEKLWEHNVEVLPKRSKNKAIEFVGVYFANNKNIKDVQESMNVQFHNLRFDRIQYRWVSVSDEFTYYDLETAKDGDLVLEYYQ